MHWQSSPLTGLYSRRFVEERLVREAGWATQQRQPLSVLMSDLDGVVKPSSTTIHIGRQ